MPKSKSPHLPICPVFPCPLTLEADGAADLAAPAPEADGATGLPTPALGPLAHYRLMEGNGATGLPAPALGARLRQLPLLLRHLHLVPTLIQAQAPAQVRPVVLDGDASPQPALLHGGRKNDFSLRTKCPRQLETNNNHTLISMALQYCTPQLLPVEIVNFYIEDVRFRFYVYIYLFRTH
jgi:hypothetical protein